MDLKRLTRMFLCDFHKKHFLRVWKVGNLATIDDQIRLVDYLWFYNAKDEEGTGKILKRKTILSLQLSVKIKDFWCWWVFEQYIGPITWFDHKKAIHWTGYTKMNFSRKQRASLQNLRASMIFPHEFGKFTHLFSKTIEILHLHFNFNKKRTKTM